MSTPEDPTRAHRTKIPSPASTVIPRLWPKPPLGHLLEDRSLQTRPQGRSLQVTPRGRSLQETQSRSSKLGTDSSSAAIDSDFSRDRASSTSCPRTALFEQPERTPAPPNPPRPHTDPSKLKQRRSVAPTHGLTDRSLTGHRLGSRETRQSHALEDLRCTDKSALQKPRRRRSFNDQESPRHCVQRPSNIDTTHR